MTRSASFRINGANLSSRNFTYTPFDIQREWYMSQIGKKTSNGDTIVDVIDISEHIIEIRLELDPKNQYLSVDNRTSFSIESQEESK